MDLFKFPFLSEVWGTVSDWAIVVVTLGTAYLLLRTLRVQRLTLEEQLKVTKTQNELFKIESLRFRESIKPILKYSGATDRMKPGDESKKILNIEVTNETNSIALKISRIVSKNEQTKQIFIPTGFSDVRDHLIKGDNALMFHFLIDATMLSFVSFALEYQDIAGTKYRQGVFCICDNHGLEIHPYLPEVIN